MAEESKARATGIGGFFFRSRDPEALKAWYAEHLGVAWGDGAPWAQKAGYTVFEPFKMDDDYFESDRTYMMNFRIDDLARLIDQLKATGIEVIEKEEWNSEIGRFARIHDPEGNPIELWEPGAPPPDSC
ncbi:MAG: VOC family protein [Pseudomonadota bacterium]